MQITTHGGTTDASDKQKGVVAVGSMPLLDSASAIDELDEWRIACNWKATNPEWDAKFKIVIAFAREGKRLAALSNDPN